MTSSSMNRMVFMLVFLPLSFSSILASGYDDQSAACDSPLAVSIPNDRWGASSTADPIKFAPHHARLNNTADTVGWCSSSNKEKKRQFIQLDLGQNMRVTALSTAGVLVKNQTTGIYSFMYVSHYFLAYKREGDKKWRRYHRNDVSVTLIKANNSELHKHHLMTPRIARHVRVWIDNAVGDEWCLKMEVHGCPWTKHDGLMSYRISQGNRRANKPGWSSLRDKGYDGTRLAFGAKVGVLYNGLGQLTDGVTGHVANWNDTGNPNWIDWIGWQDSLTADPTVTFHFSSLRRFSSVRFHILNLPGQHEKMLFSKVILSFSKDGEYFAWKTIYEPSMNKRTSMYNKAFWIQVNLEGHVGKDVTCDFQYYGWWVLISEVEFESVDIFPNDVHDTNKTSITPTTSTNSVIIIDTTDEITVDESSKDITSEDGWNIVLIAGLAAGVVGAILLCALAVLILRRRKRRTRAEEAFNRNPIRIINPGKKNSLNRRNDPGAAMRLEKLKMLEKGEEEEEDDEEEEMGLMLEKCNLNNIRNMGLREDFLKADEVACRNLRPQSREISLEEEKAAVLAEMRKVSESSDE